MPAIATRFLEFCAVKEVLPVHLLQLSAVICLSLEWDILGVKIRSLNVTIITQLGLVFREMVDFSLSFFYL
jgi:hypothetical protein